MTFKSRVYSFFKSIKSKYLNSSFDGDLTISQINDHYWLQGSVFDRSTHRALEKQLKFKIEDTDVCILITQSCNIVCDDFEKEPYVEVLVANKLSSNVDGNFTSSKSPRQLHFYMEIDNEKHAYEVYAKNKFNLPRQLLAQLQPSSSIKLVDIKVMIAWIVARYDRTAFPDSFNERIGSADKDALRKSFTKLSDVSCVYIALNSWDELNNTDTYEAHLVFIMPCDIFDQPEKRIAVTTHSTKIESILNSCNGISASSELVSEADFTLHDARQMKRWDDYTYLSHRNPNHSISKL
ncbi:MAG TPA: hypothetical protein VGJ90_07565 [Methylophilaceae bacterium]